MSDTSDILPEANSSSASPVEGNRSADPSGQTENHSLEEPSNRNGIRPWGFLLALIGVAIIESVLAFTPLGDFDSAVFGDARLYPTDRPPSELESLIHWQFIQMLDGDHEDVEVVFMGDSSTLMGVVPDEVQDHIEEDVLNLGLIAWTSVDGHRAILELFVEKYGAPKVVVYQASSRLFAQSDQFVEDRAIWPLMRQWLGERDEGLSERWPSYALRLRARQLVTPTEYQEEFLSVPTSMGTDAEIREELFTNRGYIFDGRPWENWRDSAPRNTNLHPDVIPQFERLFDFAEEEGFELLVIHAPVPETFVSDQLFNETVAVYHGIEELANTRENVHMAMPFLRAYPEDHFVNYEHLQRDAALLNSQELATDFVAPLLDQAPPQE